MLHVIERFRFDEIAEIMQIDTAEASELVAIAMEEMERAVAGRVMVIEDEAIIAMDIVDIVTRSATA